MLEAAVFYELITKNTLFLVLKRYRKLYILKISRLLV